MDGSTKFLPENDVQQMFELQGRVYAAEVYIRSVTFPERDILLAMLGAEPDKVTALKEQLKKTQDALEVAEKRIHELEDYDEGILVDDDVFDFMEEMDDDEATDFLFGGDDDLIADSEYKCEEAVHDEE